MHAPEALPGGRLVGATRRNAARAPAWRLVVVLAFLSLTSLACSLGGALSLVPRSAPATTPTNTPATGPTRILLATFTPTPYVPPTPLPTNTVPPPTETPTPTATASDTPVPPTPTPTPLAYVNANARDTTVREGPGNDYPVLGQIQPGTRYEIRGQNAGDNEADRWWYICCVRGRRVWVSAGVVTTSGDGSGAPVEQVGPPPTPTWTATPSPTATITPTPVPLFYRSIGPQFYCTNNPFLKVWVKVYFANGDPMPGYQLKVFRREGIDIPGNTTSAPGYPLQVFRAVSIDMPGTSTPTPGYLLKVVRRESIAITGTATPTPTTTPGPCDTTPPRPYRTPTLTPTPTGTFIPPPTASATPTPNVYRAPWVDLSDGALSGAEFFWTQPPGFGDRQAFNLEFTQYPDPGTGTYIVYLADTAGNPVSEQIIFTAEPSNPNREVYIGFRHIR